MSVTRERHCIKGECRLTLPLFWGGGRWRGLGSSGMERSEGPRGPGGADPSCRMGPEILMAGRPFLLPPLRSDILDRSSDMAGDQHARHAMSHRAQGCGREWERDGARFRPARWTRCLRAVGSDGKLVEIW
jgi:hypothetical protein